jgi:hypothetical protein
MFVRCMCVLVITEVTVSLDNICGKCQVIYSEDSLDNRTVLDKFFAGGPDRFFFSEVGIIYKYVSWMCGFLPSVI